MIAMVVIMRCLRSIDGGKSLAKEASRRHRLLCSSAMVSALPRGLAGSSLCPRSIGDAQLADDQLRTSGEAAMRAGMLAAALAMSALMLTVGTAVTAQDSQQTVRPETAKVRLSVGGQASIYYLPLAVPDRLGYFKQAGLDVEITDLQGGARALQALMGGSADVVTGAYDHTIQMHAKGQPIVAVVQLGRFPGFALGIVASKVAAYRSPRDLKGMK